MYLNSRYQIASQNVDASAHDDMRQESDRALKGGIGLHALETVILLKAWNS